MQLLWVRIHKYFACVSAPVRVTIIMTLTAHRSGVWTKKPSRSSTQRAQHISAHCRCRLWQRHDTHDIHARKQGCRGCLHAHPGARQQTYRTAMVSLLREAWNPTWEQPRGCALICRWRSCWPRPFPPRLMMFDDLQHTYHNATRQHPVLLSRAESEPYLCLYIVMCLLYYDIAVQPRILSFGYPYGHNSGE